MKKYILFGYLLFLGIVVQSQNNNQNNSDEKFDYKILGYVELKKFDKKPKIDDGIWEAGKYRFNKVAEETAILDNQEFEFVILELVNFTSKFKYVNDEERMKNVKPLIQGIEAQYQMDLKNLTTQKENDINNVVLPDYTNEVQIAQFNKTKANIETEYISDAQILLQEKEQKLRSIKKPYQKIKIYKEGSDESLVEPIKIKPLYVDIEEQGQKFYLRKDKFNSLISKGYIKKRYETPYQFAYGANLSLPFKIRPRVKEQNIKITPEISLGGYAGGRIRLNRYKPVYLYAPIITAGVTTIGINRNNIIDESTNDVGSLNNIDDALVLARTFSIGTFLEYDTFQIGFVGGWDRPGGEVAKEWIHNDKFWYSFSIGYNFLRRSDDK